MFKKLKQSKPSEYFVKVEYFVTEHLCFYLNAIIVLRCQ